MEKNTDYDKTLFTTSCPENLLTVKYKDRGSESYKKEESQKRKHGYLFVSFGLMIPFAIALSFFSPYGPPIGGGYFWTVVFVLVSCLFLLRLVEAVYFVIKGNYQAQLFYFNYLSFVASILFILYLFVTSAQDILAPSFGNSLAALGFFFIEIPLFILYLPTAYFLYYMTRYRSSILRKQEKLDSVKSSVGPKPGEKGDVVRYIDQIEQKEENTEKEKEQEFIQDFIVRQEQKKKERQ